MSIVYTLLQIVYQADLIAPLIVCFVLSGRRKTGCANLSGLFKKKNRSRISAVHENESGGGRFFLERNVII